MKPIIDLERTIVFVFQFFVNMEPIIPSSGRLILIKNLCYYWWNRYFVYQNSSLENASFYEWQRLLCLVQTSCQYKTLIWLIKTKFLGSSNHSLHFFRYYCESFISATGNLFYVQYKKYAFIQSLFSIVGNHY